MVFVGRAKPDSSALVGSQPMSNPKAKRAPPLQLHGELAVWTLRTHTDVMDWLETPFEPWTPFRRHGPHDYCDFKGDHKHIECPIDLLAPFLSDDYPKTQWRDVDRRGPDFPHIAFLFWNHVSGENYKLHAEIEDSSK